MSTWNTYHVNVFMNMISCLQTTYHVNVVMNTISGLHDMRFMNMLTWYGSCVQTYCFMCEWYVSCWRILVVQDHVFKSCTVDDHIVNTWWILWKHGWWVPYHLYISCTMLMVHWTWVTWLISCTHDTVTSCVVTKTYHVSCVVTKAGLSCVCVCTAQLAAHVSVSSTLQGHNLMSLAHDHIFGSESHTNGEIMSQWETCCWYTCTFGLGLRHKFPFTVTGLSYQDPISLFRFIKFIKTKFQRTPRLCRV